MVTINNAMGKTGKFLYELARADLAVITYSLALPVLVTADTINYLRTGDESRLFGKTLSFGEGALKFAEGH